MTDTEKARSIVHPATWMGARWKALELLFAAYHEGRPDGTYQGGYELGELKRRTGITDAELGMLASGEITRRSRWSGADPDRAWGIEITPRGESLIAYGHMVTFLESIASADPQSEQAAWMVRMAREGLRRDVRH
jgi:hypothetical protein